MTITYKGELEIDVRRGVIYFHDSETGQTRLRIQGLADGPISLKRDNPGRMHLDRSPDAVAFGSSQHLTRDTSVCYTFGVGKRSLEQPTEVQK